MTRRKKLDDVVKDVIRPLLAVEGHDIEVQSFDGDTVVLCLIGRLNGDPAATIVKRGVIEPALERALGKVSVTYALPSYTEV